MKIFVAWCLKVTLAAGLLTANVFACQPCESSLNLDDSIARADLVIVGARTDYDAEETQPQSIKVKVTSVLKGEVKAKTIEVRSWYGMCPYGIVVDDQTYVIILMKSHQTPDTYEAVKQGCSVRTLLVESDTVTHEGQKVSLESFKAKYGLKEGS